MKHTKYNATIAVKKIIYFYFFKKNEIICKLSKKIYLLQTNTTLFLKLNHIIDFTKGSKIKNVLIVSMLAFVGLQAHATKARLQSLNGSIHLVDSQTPFSAPLDLLEQPSYVNIESGITNSINTDDNASGIMSYSLTDKSRIAIGLGHQDNLTVDSRHFMNSVLGADTYKMGQNPIHIMYANKTSDNFSYGFNLNYSNYKDKKSQLTSSSSGGVLGLQFGSFQLYNAIGFNNSADAAGNKKFDGPGQWTINALYTYNTLVFSLLNTMMNAKSSTNSIEDQSHSLTKTEIAVVDSIKKDGNDFFYGATIIAKLKLKINYLIILFHA